LLKPSFIIKITGMKILKISKKAYLLLTMMGVLACIPGHSQEVLEVLPAEGRNQLFHDYLMEELDT